MVLRELVRRVWECGRMRVCMYRSETIAGEIKPRFPDVDDAWIAVSGVTIVYCTRRSCVLSDS